MERRTQLARRLPTLIGALVVIVLLAIAIWFVYGIVTNKDVKAARKVQVVQVIRPPPPPPPEEKPPPPPELKPQEQVPQDEPEPAPSNDPAPAESPGLDAEGVAGGDSFGLAARKGGRDIAGSGGAIFAWYTNRVKDRIVEKLGDDAKIRSKKFSISVKVWIEPDGRIRDVKLGTTSGNRELDAAIESALLKLAKMSEGPPLEMPQPIILKIVSRS